MAHAIKTMLPGQLHQVDAMPGAARPPHDGSVTALDTAALGGDPPQALLPAALAAIAVALAAAPATARTVTLGRRLHEAAHLRDPVPDLALALTSWWLPQHAAGQRRRTVVAFGARSGRGCHR
jgi:hypothetical protein